MDYRKVGEKGYQVDVTKEDDLIGGIGWMLVTEKGVYLEDIIDAIKAYDFKYLDEEDEEDGEC